MRIRPYLPMNCYGIAAIILVRNNIMKKGYALLLLLMTTFCLHAQNKSSIGVNFIYGPKIFDTKGTYKGIGVNYNISTVNNTAEWTKILNVENININATLYDLSDITACDRMASYIPKFCNKGYFGYDIALESGIDMRLANLSGVKLLFSPGLGLIYSTKDYASTGGVNQMLGRKLNIIGSAKLKLDIPVTEDTHIKIGTGFAHISNAGTAMPNNALNRIESFVGVTQGLSSPKINANGSKFKLDRDAISVEMIVGYTSQVKTGFYQLKGVNLQMDNSFRKSTAPIGKASVSAAYSHYLNDVIGVRAGTDVVYSSRLSALGSTTSDTAEFIRTFQGDYTPINSHINVGLNAGLDICLGRFVFTTSYGYYLGKYEKYVYIQGGNKFVNERQTYTTFACRYFITPKIAVEAKSYMHSFGGVGLNVNF
jgi:hypothetical protein